MVRNPFTPTFGIQPLVLAGRSSIIDSLAQAFEHGPGDPNLSTLLVGPRGCGKTVLLDQIASQAEALGWLTARVTAEPGMLNQILEQITSLGSSFLAPPTRRQITGISVSGIGLQTQLVPPTPPSWRMQMTRLLEQLDAHKVGVLLSVDEVSPNLDEMISLVVAYQHFVRENRKVALLMAGLPGRVTQLLNHQTVSFLRRAFRHDLGAVSLAEAELAIRRTIESSGRQILPGAAAAAAAMSGGYPFLIQLVGYHTWRQHSATEPITEQAVTNAGPLVEADMETMVFQATLHELSPKDLAFVVAMAAENEPVSTKVIGERLAATSATVAQYRRRLIARGVIHEAGFGKVAFELPLLRDYLRRHYPNS